MKEFKAISINKIHTYIIDASEYLNLIQFLNENKMFISRIKATYVATCISDRLIVDAQKKNT